MISFHHHFHHYIWKLNPFKMISTIINNLVFSELSYISSSVSFCHHHHNPHPCPMIKTKKFKHFNLKSKRLIMMLLSEFGRNRNTLTPLCNMKKTCIQEPRGKLEYTLKTIMQHEKKNVCPESVLFHQRLVRRYW